MNKINIPMDESRDEHTKGKKSGSGSDAGFYKRLQLRTAVPLHRIYAYFYVTY